VRAWSFVLGAKSTKDHLGDGIGVPMFEPKVFRKKMYCIVVIRCPRNCVPLPLSLRQISTYRGATVVKFHFINLKLREKQFSTKSRGVVGR